MVCNNSGDVQNIEKRPKNEKVNQGGFFVREASWHGGVVIDEMSIDGRTYDGNFDGLIEFGHEYPRPGDLELTLSALAQVTIGYWQRAIASAGRCRPRRL